MLPLPTLPQEQQLRLPTHLLGLRLHLLLRLLLGLRLRLHLLLGLGLRLHRVSRLQELVLPPVLQNLPNVSSVQPTFCCRD